VTRLAPWSPRAGSARQVSGGASNARVVVQRAVSVVSSAAVSAAAVSAAVAEAATPTARGAAQVASSGGDGSGSGGIGGGGGCVGALPSLEPQPGGAAEPAEPATTGSPPPPIRWRRGEAIGAGGFGQVSGGSGVGLWRETAQQGLQWGPRTAVPRMLTAGKS